MDTGRIPPLLFVSKSLAALLRGGIVNRGMRGATALLQRSDPRSIVFLVFSRNKKTRNLFVPVGVLE